MQPLLFATHLPRVRCIHGVEPECTWPTVRGQLRSARWGVEFRARGPFPDFLPTLAAWVQQHHQRWPGLAVLIDARLTVRDNDGEIVERFKDDDAWAPLRPGAE